MKLPLSKTNLIIIGAAVLAILAIFFVWQKMFSQPEAQGITEVVELPFDPEGPYALLTPRRDGHALNLEIRRINSFDAFSYQIAYLDQEGIERGAGSLDTWIELSKGKTDYQQEILFGSCSSGGKCSYDEGVENGTLTMQLKKGQIAYRMITQWHLQQPEIALGVLTSGDNHFRYQVSSASGDLSLVKFTIINDLSGAPKLASGKTVVGKVYAINTPSAKTLPKGNVTIELAENVPSGSKIYRFDESQNGWIEYPTTVNGSVAAAEVDGSGIVTILSSN